jgi:hypothetical protein
LPSKEIEDRIMSERRPQPMPPTPGNPTLYAALEAISELGSDDPAEGFQKRPQQPMCTGETVHEFYARRQPLEDLWNSFMSANRSREFPAPQTSKEMTA